MGITFLRGLLGATFLVACSSSAPGPGAPTAGVPANSGGTSGSGGSGLTATGGSAHTDAGPGAVGVIATPAAPDAAPADVAPLPADAPASVPRFSFFVTSLAAMRMLSGSQDGFGGDLRHGEATGLAGADKICREIAEVSLPGAGAKNWRAFLSATKAGPGGAPVNAIDRVGEGPWYDRLGRLLAASKADLVQRRPRGADPAIVNDLPNETGLPNHEDGAPGCAARDCPDNHDTMTGTDERGLLVDANPGSTCDDWTSSARTGRPWCGHSWPRGAGDANWMSTLAEGGCAPGVNLMHQGGPNAATVGSGGGYGGIYCFALTP
jgi:hypothetical protein